jgi:hypothetical protein
MALGGRVGEAQDPSCTLARSELDGKGTEFRCFSEALQSLTWREGAGAGFWGKERRTLTMLVETMETDDGE